MTPRREILAALEAALRTLDGVEVVVNPPDDIVIDPGAPPVLALHDGGETPGPAPQNASRAGAMPRVRQMEPVVVIHARGGRTEIAGIVDGLYERITAAVLLDQPLRVVVQRHGGGIEVGDYDPEYEPGQTTQGVASLTLDISYVLHPTKLTR